MKKPTKIMLLGASLAAISSLGGYSVHHKANLELKDMVKLCERGVHGYLYGLRSQERLSESKLFIMNVLVEPNQQICNKSDLKALFDYPGSDIFADPGHIQTRIAKHDDRHDEFIIGLWIGAFLLSILSIPFLWYGFVNRVRELSSAIRGSQ